MGWGVGGKGGGDGGVVVMGEMGPLWGWGRCGGVGRRCRRDGAGLGGLGAVVGSTWRLGTGMGRFGGCCGAGGRCEQQLGAGG